jgi:hypothetical protein
MLGLAAHVESLPGPVFDRTPTERDDDLAVAHAPTQLAAPEPPLRWGRLFAMVSLAAALAAGGIVALLVWRDAHPRTPRVRAQPAPVGADLEGRAAVPGPVGNEPALMDLLRRWDSAVRLQPGAQGLERFYAPRVSWNAQSMDVAGIAAQTERSVLAGGTNAFDWARSTWEREAPDGADVPATCRAVPGAVGDVVKVRAWNNEYRPDRHAAIGCPRLEGVYLLRLRRTPAGMRICHETWSMADGVCASCPGAPACVRR